MSVTGVGDPLDGAQRATDHQPDGDGGEGEDDRQADEQLVGELLVDLVQQAAGGTGYDGDRLPGQGGPDGDDAYLGWDHTVGCFQPYGVSDPAGSPDRVRLAASTRPSGAITCACAFGSRVEGGSGFGHAPVGSDCAAWVIWVAYVRSCPSIVRRPAFICSR